MIAVVAWMLAAFFVAVVPYAAVKVAIIVVVAFAYMTPHRTLNHALAVGATWLALAVAVELAMSAHLHHAWSALLGSPAHPATRVLLLISWVAAPALFARESAVDAAQRPPHRG